MPGKKRWLASIALVGSLAHRWGVRPATGGGKTVWFEVQRSPEDNAEPPGKT